MGRITKLKKPVIGIVRYSPGSANVINEAILQTDLDVLVLQCYPLFPFSGKGSVLPLIEQKTAEGTLVFLVTGQRGYEEQRIVRRKELECIGVGAIPLGNANLEAGSGSLEYLLGLKQSVISDEEFAADVGAILQLFETKEEAATEIQRKYFRPAMEAEECLEISNWLHDGGTLEFGKFVYTDILPWMAVKNDPQYKPLNQTTHETNLEMVPEILKEMKNRGIVDFYSMGPTTDVDKVLLGEAVKQKQMVKYHGIDISANILQENKSEIEMYLRSIDANWKMYVELVDEKAQLFDEVSTSGKVCVSYSGGQIVNNPHALESAREICQEGGLIVADLHTHSQDGDHADLWKSFYDIKAEREMFRKAVLQFMPHLATTDGWHINVAYATSDSEPDKISFQLAVDNPLETYCNHLKITLQPGVSRELMMSRKYYLPEFEAEAHTLGLEKIFEKSIRLPQRDSSHAKGFGTTILLGYDRNVAVTELKTIPNYVNLRDAA